MVVLPDVSAGSQWFQTIVGLRSAHGGDEYDMLMSADRLVLQLHRWEEHDHPHLGDRADPSRGNGVLLWFRVDDFDQAMERVKAEAVEVLDGPLANPNAGHREVWVRGPEGYTVVLAGA